VKRLTLCVLAASVLAQGSAPAVAAPAPGGFYNVLAAGEGHTANAADLAAFENMIGRAREAFQRRDSVTLAAIATESATLNQRFVPMRKFWEIRDVAASFHALGVQISHSGTVAGILFDARSIAGSDDALVDERQEEQPGA